MNFLSLDTKLKSYLFKYKKYSPFCWHFVLYGYTYPTGNIILYYFSKAGNPYLQKNPAILYSEQKKIDAIVGKLETMGIPYQCIQSKNEFNDLISCYKPPVKSPFLFFSQ